MARPSKLTPYITKLIGDGVSLGLTHSLAAESAGITYQTLNQWLQRGQTDKYGKYYQFAQHIKKCNAEGAKKLLESLNAAAKAGYTRICMWILERRFSGDFGRRVYRKTNVISENKNENMEIIVKDTDAIRNEILNRLSMIGEL